MFKRSHSYTYTYDWQVSDVFYKQGLGDAMITYENEIVLTNEKIVEVCFISKNYVCFVLS